MSKDKSVKVYLSRYKQKRKPSASFVRTIQRTILSDSTDITLKDFANELTTSGRTTILCQFKDDFGTPKKDTPIISQELIMLDFDNVDKENPFNIEDLHKDTFLMNHALFWYRTMSDQESLQDRFRVVCRLDKPLTDNSKISDVYSALLKKYPQADSTSRNVARLFFGGIDGYNLISWENTLDTDSILNGYYKNIKEDKEKEPIPTKKGSKESDIQLKNYTSSITHAETVWQCIKTNNYTAAMKLTSEKIASGELDFSKKVFPDRQSFVEYIKENVDISIFLDLPKDNTTFLDIFHYEKSPSATVFKSDSGAYLYKCFSSSHDYTGNIIMVVQKLMPSNSNYIGSIDFIARCLNATIDHNSKVGRIKENTILLSDRLIDPDLKITSPYVYNVFRNNQNLAKILLEVLMNNLHEDLVVSDEKLVSFLSLDTLTDKCNIRMDPDGYSAGRRPLVSKSKVSRVINLLTLTGVTNKLSDSNAPKWLVKLLNDFKEEKNHAYRSEIYEIDFVEGVDSFKKLETSSKMLFENDFKTYRLSYSYILRLLGEEYANRVYVQKPEKARGLSKSEEDFEQVVVSTIFETLNKQGYILADKLVLAISRKLVTTKKEAKLRLDIAIQDICNKYGISEQKFNKEYRDIYNPPRVKTAVKFYIKEINVIKK